MYAAPTKCCAEPHKSVGEYSCFSALTNNTNAKNELKRSLFAVYSQGIKDCLSPIHLFGRILLFSITEWFACTCIAWHVCHLWTRKYILSSQFNFRHSGVQNRRFSIKCCQSSQSIVLYIWFAGFCMPLLNNKLPPWIWVIKPFPLPS